MTEQNAERNARAEAARGDEALGAAKLLAEGGFAADAVSRAYYAAYHYARAVLLTKGLEPRTHRGVIQLFSLHFVKTGQLSQEATAALARLETSRELGDYAPTAAFDQDEANELIREAESFIAACRPLLPG